MFAKSFFIRNIEDRFDLTGFNLSEASIGGKETQVRKAARKIQFYVNLYSNLNAS